MLDRVSDEERRHATLERLSILDTAPEREFDVITRAATRLLGCKYSNIALIDGDRLWFKSRHNIEHQQIARESSFCAVAAEQGRPLIIEDIQSHPLYSQLPVAIERPEVRFLAALPFWGPELDGHRAAIGALCLIDEKVRSVTPEEMDELSDLTHIIEALCENRLTARLANERAAKTAAMMEDLRRTHRQFDLAEEMAKLGSWRMDLETNEVEWSRQTIQIHGLEEMPKENLTKNALEYYPPRDRKRISEAVEKCIRDGTPYDLELDFNNAQGKRLRVRAMGEAELVDGKPKALIGVFQDVTERHRNESKLREAAFTDELTRLANRKRLNEFLDEEIERARRTGTRLAIALIDLDKFKQANDRFGHEMGDKVLCHMADQLRKGPFKSHLAARLGGDEFILVIEEGEHLNDLDALLDELLTALQYEIPESDGSLKVTATVGAAWLNPDIVDRSDMLRCADIALYRAKEDQRGTASIYENPIPLRPIPERRKLRVIR